MQDYIKDFQKVVYISIIKRFKFSIKCLEKYVGIQLEVKNVTASGTPNVNLK